MLLMKFITLVLSKNLPKNIAKDITAGLKIIKNEIIGEYEIAFLRSIKDNFSVGCILDLCQ